jgi:hypothetical protein
MKITNKNQKQSVLPGDNHPGGLSTILQDRSNRKIHSD